MVFPELIDLERLSYLGPYQGADVPRALAPDFPATLERARELAEAEGMTLVAGSHLRESDRGFVNTAIIAWPGGYCLQDKNVLTQWELRNWHLTEGKGLVIPHSVPLGVNICYDVEFPIATRALCESGARLIAVPAFTETKRGFNRVRRSLLARVIENQVFGIHAALVGSLGREPAPTTYGQSAIVCPHVRPFPSDGILTKTEPNTEGIAIADIDLSIIDQIRNDDDVRNWHDRHRGDWNVQKV